MYFSPFLCYFSTFIYAVYVICLNKCRKQNLLSVCSKFTQKSSTNVRKYLCKELKFKTAVRFFLTLSNICVIIPTETNESGVFPNKEKRRLACIIKVNLLINKKTERFFFKTVKTNNCLKNHIYGGTMENQRNYQHFAFGERHRTMCAQCGYLFERGDEALRVHETGDIIHKDCWQEYTDDNLYQMSDAVEF